MSSAYLMETFVNAIDECNLKSNIQVKAYSNYTSLAPYLTVSNLNLLENK